jgi:hypothetical protein
VSTPALNTDRAIDVWREAVEAGLRYWGRLGRLAFESVTALVSVAGEPRTTVDRPQPPGAPRTILLEAAAGESAVGVFLVENTTVQVLSGPVQVSSFVDEQGREVRPAIAFRPDVVVLDPGDQSVVQVAAAVDETFEAEVRYRAEISVPGLSETRVPIVVRRRSRTSRRAGARAATTTRA